MNEDIQGNVNELRTEIQRLKAELALERPGGGKFLTPSVNRLLLSHMILIQLLLFGEKI